jgi:enamine deaminase RidA (YjgF/YER057c/UK114 family)
MTNEERFRQLGLDLPPAPKAIGVYKPAVLVGNLLMTSGHGPLRSDGQLIKGTVGAGASVEDGYAAAQQTGLALLATIRKELGTLDRVVRLVKTLGFVQCTPEFDQHPAVINGCSELMAKVFGEQNGVGARSALGVISLPLGMMVEVEIVVEIT